jgi:hypothetical protein
MHDLIPGPNDAGTGAGACVPLPPRSGGEGTGGGRFRHAFPKEMCAHTSLAGDVNKRSAWR